MQQFGNPPIPLLKCLKKEFSKWKIELEDEINIAGLYESNACIKFSGKGR